MKNYHILNIIDEDALIYDLRTTQNARKAWFLFKADPYKHSEFKKVVVSEKSFNLEDYGKILYSGWGEPGEGIKDAISTKFGMIYK